MAGLLTRPRVRFTVAMSSAVVLRLYWAAIHSCPSAWSAGITLLKHEPSAQMPWQNTMLGLVPFMLLSFLDACGEVNSFISRPPCLITPAAIVPPVIKRNWRRLDRGDSGERS